MAKSGQEVVRALQSRPPRPAHETPPMMVNDISHLFFAMVRSKEPEGVLSQHSARVVLRLLIRCDGMKQRELAQQAHLSAPTISATLRRMQEEGLIVRRGCEQDGRAIGVYLTELGRARHESMIAMLRSLDEVLMQGFDEQETRQLSELLARMRGNIVQSMCGVAEEDQ